MLLCCMYTADPASGEGDRLVPVSTIHINPLSLWRTRTRRRTFHFADCTFKFY